MMLSAKYEEIYRQEVKMMKLILQFHSIQKTLYQTAIEECDARLRLSQPPERMSQISPEACSQLKLLIHNYSNEL